MQIYFHMKVKTEKMIKNKVKKKRSNNNVLKNCKQTAKKIKPTQEEELTCIV